MVASISIKAKKFCHTKKFRHDQKKQKFLYQPLSLENIEEYVTLLLHCWIHNSFYPRHTLYNSFLGYNKHTIKHEESYGESWVCKLSLNYFSDNVENPSEITLVLLPDYIAVSTLIEKRIGIPRYTCQYKIWASQSVFVHLLHKKLQNGSKQVFKILCTLWKTALSPFLRGGVKGTAPLIKRSPLRKFSITIALA